MPFELERMHAEKNRIVRELFIDTADDNYIIARWCAVEYLNVDFFWLAVHDLEKYMKAVLLLNGQSGKAYKNASGKTKQFGHDIVALYGAVQKIAVDLLPSTLTKPKDMDIPYWRDETPIQFLERLYKYGNADNRYQIFGFVRHNEDLFKFDQMVFYVRRLCRFLDAYMVGDVHDGEESPTFRDLLTNNPDWWGILMTSKLEKAINGKRGDQLRSVALNLNLKFAPEDYPHQGMRSVAAGHNPVLVRSIIEPLQNSNDTEVQQLASEVRDWVIGNIKLPTDVKTQLNNLKPKTAGKD